MSELQDYYDNFATQPSLWADPDKERCACRGGWFVSDLDTVHKCPYHWRGQPHPEDDVNWQEYAAESLVGFYGRALAGSRSVPSGRQCWPADPTDDLPF